MLVCSTSNTFRTKLKPLEWTPEEGRAMTTSPGTMALWSTIFFLSNAHGEPSQIIFVYGIKAGHFCSLAANESRTCLDAALCHAGHQFGNPLRHVFTTGNVIQEEQRLGPAADHIIDTHGHAVDAHRVVLVQKGRPSGAWCPRRRCRRPAPAPHSPSGSIRRGRRSRRYHPGSPRFCPGDVRFHQFHGPVSGSDVHTGCLIAFGIAFFVHAFGSFSEFPLEVEFSGIFRDLVG